MTTNAVLTIVNDKGLHARASAKFAALAEQFDAQVRVTRDNLTVSATSIMGLLMLTAAKGCDIAVEADGPQAAEALAALSDLVNRRFDEER